MAGAGAELTKFDTDFDKGVKGFGAHLGTIVPISNGDLTVGAYYVDGTAETSQANVEERDFDYMGLATKYEYRLSKRTSVYLAAGYYREPRSTPPPRLVKSRKRSVKSSWV